MPEDTGESPGIEEASKHASIESLREKAESTKWKGGEIEGERKEREKDSTKDFFDIHQDLKEVQDQMGDPSLLPEERQSLEERAEELSERLDGIIDQAGFSFVHRTIRQEGAEFARGVEDKLRARQGELVDLAEDEGLFNDACITIPEVLAYSTWDNFRTNLVGARGNLASAARACYRDNPELEGLLETVINGTIAGTAVGGIVQKAAKVRAAGGDQIPKEWFQKHYPDKRRLDRLWDDFREDYLYPVAGPDLAGMVREARKGWAGQDEMTQVLEQNRGILEDLREDRFSLQQALLLQRKQTEAMTQLFGRQTSWDERARWTDVGYKQEFYQRFTPNIEPRFYTNMSAEERTLWEDKWFLSRGAYYRKAASGFPEKYVENNDFVLFTKEKLRNIYKEIPGARKMIEAYAQVFVNGRRVKVPGKVINKPDKKTVEMNFWEIESSDEFEAFRAALRAEELSQDPDLLEKAAKLFNENVGEVVPYRAREESRLLGRELTDGEFQDIQKKFQQEVVEVLGKEADSVAWDLMLVSVQIESSDSYYSHSGRLYYKMPDVMNSTDFRGILHPMERYFGKVLIDQYWGAFTPWGIAQMERIKKECGLDMENDQVDYQPAKPGDNWSWEETKEGVTEKKSDKKKKDRRVIIYAPECCPVTTTGSFLEETKTTNEKGEKKTLLQLLADRDDIVWDDVPDDATKIWLFSKFLRGVKLVEYYNPGKPFEQQKFGWVKEWADPLKHIMFARLKIKETLEGIRDRGITTYQTVHNLKAWPVYAAFGGVADVMEREPRLNIAGLPTVDRPILVGALRDRNVRYLDRGETLEIT